MFDDKNITKLQTPAAALTPVQTCEEEDKVPCSNHHLGKSLAFESLSLNVYQRQLQHALNITIMMQN